MSEKKIIPIQPALNSGEPLPDELASNCAGGEPFALMVLDDKMEPEFLHGDIIVCEPEGLAKDGSFVVAKVDNEFYFRQLQIRDDKWQLTALNPIYPTLDISGPDEIVAVVVLKKKPGRRKEQKFYI